MTGPYFRQVAKCAAGCILVVLLASVLPAASGTTFVVNNKVPNSPGGQRFRNELGAEKMRTVLSDAARFIHGKFSLSTPKNIPTVTLVVESMPGGVAVTGGSTIHLSAEYIANQPRSGTAALVHEISGVVYHESTHVWQNNNGNINDKFFIGVIEGIADWIRLKAGLASNGWPKRARGGNWYDGYTTTAYFLNWIENTQEPNFVNELNRKMAQPWSNDFFRQIVGKSVDQLWQQYQNSI